MYISWFLNYNSTYKLDVTAVYSNTKLSKREDAKHEV